jgi:hypothetical protein
MRFPLEVPVVFWWKDDIGERRQVEGRTYDVSEMGVFVLASFCPPVGAHVNLKISIAGLPDPAQFTRMEMQGRVLRVEQTGMGQGRNGFAILSEQTILHEEGEDAGDWRN